MRLGDIIESLARCDPSMVVEHGFHGPHSYRGSYECLAFEPCKKRTTIGKMLECAHSAIGRIYTGYKGGNYEMGEWSDCYLAEYGETGEEITSAHLTIWTRIAQDQWGVRHGAVLVHDQDHGDTAQRYTVGLDVTDGRETIVVMRLADDGTQHVVAEGTWPPQRDDGPDGDEAGSVEA